MRDLYRIEDMVKDVLTNVPASRNSDNYLYFMVCQRLDNGVLDRKLGDVLLGFNGCNMPRYESVSRARRKLQAQFPELRATKAVDKGRYEKSIDFQKYARSEVRNNGGREMD